jgi:hypothetical protein
LADDKARTHQGWGLIDLGRMYLLREAMPVIIDESEVLDTPGQEVVRYVSVPSNTHALRATLVYADPPGSEAVQERHAVNDLTLKVTAPDGTTHYWGDCGLREGNWSSSACTQGDHPFLYDPDDDVIDTVENVFVQNPGVGTWTVRVIADEINDEGHPETPETDVDFALVVSIDPDCNQNGRSDPDEVLAGDVRDCNGDGTPEECEGCPLSHICCGSNCYECCTDDDCTGGMHACLPTTHTCVECMEHGDCEDPERPYCGELLTCVECIDDNDCTGPKCYCGVFGSCLCCQSPPCPMGPSGGG